MPTPATKGKLDVFMGVREMIFQSFKYRRER